MNIELVKRWVEGETAKGNTFVYKQLLSFCVKIYKRLNKDKVSVWNQNYKEKVRVLKGNPSTTNNKKGNTSNKGVEIY